MVLLILILTMSMIKIYWSVSFHINIRLHVLFTILCVVDNRALCNVTRLRREYNE